MYEHHSSHYVHIFIHANVDMNPYSLVSEEHDTTHVRTYNTYECVQFCMHWCLTSFVVFEDDFNNLVHFPLHP